MRKRGSKNQVVEFLNSLAMTQRKQIRPVDYP